MPTSHQTWLALAIGNSKLHWACFCEDRLQATWNTPHMRAMEVERLARSNFDPNAWTQCDRIPTIPQLNAAIPIWMASVVPEQAELWQTYAWVETLALDNLPLGKTYPTLGIDRALAVVGAGSRLGYPSLAIDSGTALTLTGADAEQTLVGGAILPGLGLQLASLSRGTAQLPQLNAREIAALPSRWSANTPEAIQSGVIYTLIAGLNDFIQAWWQQFPESGVALTGGDREVLWNYLRKRFPETAARVTVDANLVFWGMQVARDC